MNHGEKRVRDLKVESPLSKATFSIELTERWCTTCERWIDVGKLTNWTRHAGTHTPEKTT